MAIFRGNGGSVEGITESDTVVIAISQGGTGATTASGARSNLGLGTAATTNSTAYATAAQGALADSALQSESDPVFSASEAASITSTDTTNWDTAYTDRLKWDGGSTGLNASTGRTSLGLGTAATTASTDYATAAQGTLADSAVQPGDLATVATSGSYNDLSNKPTIPTDLNSLTDVVITTPSTNQVLQYNGTNWVNATGGGGGSGTVTSVAMSVPTGLSVSGSPITTSGTLAVTLASGYSIPTTTSQTNWDTAFTDRFKWDGGSTGLTASTGRTSLGATTVGSNLFTLTNPSAITFPRFNADNTVSSLTASDFRTAIGAGTGSGTVTSVGGTGTVNGLTLTGTVTSSGNLTLGGTLDLSSPPAIGSTSANTGAFTTLSASGVSSFAAGSAAAPALTRTGDTNTGIYFPGADRIGFSEGGTQVGEFDASGNFLFNSGYGSAAIAYGCRAWVNFNGTGTVAIRASGNVTSITDNGTGDYTVNFTTALVDANYAAVGSVGGTSASAVTFFPYDHVTPRTTTAFRFLTLTTAGGTADSAQDAVSIFR